MDALATYAATAAVMASLMIFSLLVLFGVWLVRALRLPQDLPPELHFEPPPPPMRAHADRADAAVVAARQARLRTVHARAFAAAQSADACRDVAIAAAGMPALAARAAAVAERARAAATAADAARVIELDAAETATAQHLAEAQAAYAEAEVIARELPPASSWRLWALLALAVLALSWLALIIALRHDLGPDPITG